MSPDAVSQRVSDLAGLPDIETQTSFCRLAEDAGIDSLLVDLNYGKPDPMVLALALARGTRRVKLMVAHRAGLMSPALFVQQVNTFSLHSEGRITLNMVAGHSPDEQKFYGDHLTHDDRYHRMDEYLTIARKLWAKRTPVDFEGKYFKVEDGQLNTPFLSAGRTEPEIYVGGSSDLSKQIAIRHASCWIRFADAPDAVARDIAEVRKGGTQVCLRLSVIARASRAEALEAAQSLIDAKSMTPRSTEEERFVRKSDAESISKTFALADDEWLSPTLWTGAVRVFGATALALVGSYEDVARGFLDFRDAGVSQFILSGWPKQDEMVRLGREVIPIVREYESRSPENSLAQTRIEAT